MNSYENPSMKSKLSITITNLLFSVILSNILFRKLKVLFLAATISSKVPSLCGYKKFIKSKISLLFNSGNSFLKYFDASFLNCKLFKQKLGKLNIKQYILY